MYSPLGGLYSKSQTHSSSFWNKMRGLNSQLVQPSCCTREPVCICVCVYPRICCKSPQKQCRCSSMKCVRLPPATHPSQSSRLPKLWVTLFFLYFQWSLTFTGQQMLRCPQHVSHKKIYFLSKFEADSGKLGTGPRTICSSSGCLSSRKSAGGKREREIRFGRYAAVYPGDPHKRSRRRLKLSRWPPASHFESKWQCSTTNDL